MISMCKDSWEITPHLFAIISDPYVLSFCFIYCQHPAKMPKFVYAGHIGVLVLKLLTCPWTEKTLSSMQRTRPNLPVSHV